MKTDQRITSTSLASIKALQRKQCLQKMHCIVNDCSHPNHRLFIFLPIQKVLQVILHPEQWVQDKLFPRVSHPSELHTPVLIENHGSQHITKVTYSGWSLLGILSCS